MTKFLIIFTGRCGGTFLSDALNNHSNIACYREILESMSWDDQLARLKDIHETPGEHLDTAKRCEAFGMERTTAKGKIEASGCLLKIWTIANMPKFEAYIKENDVKLIHLFRMNSVRHGLSLYVGRELKRRVGHYNIWKDDDRILPIEIDMARFKTEMMMQIERSKSTWEWIERFPRSSVAYEYMNGRKEQVFGELCKILNVSGPITPTNQLKIMPDDLSKAIKNWDEFSNAMRCYAEGSFAGYLD